jgi:hypothetical protein
MEANVRKKDIRKSTRPRPSASADRVIVVVLGTADLPSAVTP